MYPSVSEAALLSRASQAVLKLSRPTKRLIMISSDAVMLPSALLLALLLKFDRFIPPGSVVELLMCAAVCGVAAFSILGLYRAVIRFMGIRAIGRIIIAVTLAALGLAG